MTIERTTRLVIAAAWLTPCAAARATPPFYDPNAYCQHAVQSGGSQQGYGTCHQQEQAAYDRVKIYWDTVPIRARAYCDGVAESVGSSYQILETCLQEQGVAARNKETPQPNR